jgi:hypothetical protein
VAEASRLALSLAVEQLEQAMTTARENLQREIDSRPLNWWVTGVAPTPEQMKDNQGRYVLLDALTTLVSAQTALVNSAPRNSE